MFYHFPETSVTAQLTLEHTPTPGFTGDGHWRVAFNGASIRISRAEDVEGAHLGIQKIRPARYRGLIFYGASRPTGPARLAFGQEPLNEISRSAWSRAVQRAPGAIR